jgi:hypothetical protein
MAGSVAVYEGGSNPVAVTRPSHEGMKLASVSPPEATTSRYESAMGTMGKAAIRPLGCCAAVKIWLMAP